MSNVVRFVRKRRRPIELVYREDCKRLFDAMVRRWEENGCKPFRVRAENLAPEFYPDLGGEPWRLEDAVRYTRDELQSLESAAWSWLASVHRTPRNPVQTAPGRAGPVRLVG